MMGSIFKRHPVLDSNADPERSSLAELFHENTKLHPDAPIGGAMVASYALAERRAMSSVGTRYHRAAQLTLPRDDLGVASIPIEKAILQRRTQRTFAETPMSLSALSKLLFLTGGVTARVSTEAGETQCLRAAPSGGALYPIEIYLGVRNVAEVAPGLYHFSPRDHALMRLSSGDPTEKLIHACHYGESLAQASVVVVFAAVFGRTLRKYGERGYRLVLLEAGHLAQNLCLASVALGLGCVNVCGFFDDRLNALFGLNGVDEAALYVAYVGSIAERHFSKVSE